MHSYAKRIMLFSVNEFLIGVVIAASLLHHGSVGGGESRRREAAELRPSVHFQSLIALHCHQN